MNRLLLFALVASAFALSASAAVLKVLIDRGALGAAAAPVASNAQSAPAAAAQKTQPGSAGRIAVLKPDQLGQFMADVTVNGHTIRMLVDTGASAVALTQQDAITLGVLPVSFNVPMRTANGDSKAGEARLSEIRVGNVQVLDTVALVLPYGVSHQSLLGMTFLKKLSGFEVTGGNLILKQ
jgi:aspartyl protease family protein